MIQLRMLLANIVQIYMIVIIIRAVLSWFRVNPAGEFFKIYLFIIQLTEPVMRPIRELQNKLIPGSPLDFSPILVIILLNLLRNILLGL
ncbi:MAG: YggT family protein [Candidatus Cloacimonetes bacterium]|nr:YggT family protein [Candidatus Cloacimonadota bacterium]